MAAPRGRGYAMQLSKTQELRQPGEAGLKLRLPTNGVSSQSPVVEDKFEKLCDKINKMDLSKDPNEVLGTCLDDVHALCSSSENLEKFVDNIFQYALKSKWNAHAVALFSEHYGDFVVQNVKLRRILLRKLQELYKGRNKAYKDLDKFLLDATFACEIFHHLRIDGNCVQVLAHPILDYLGMLIDGASLKETEVFVEQFPKCFKNLKENDAAGFDTLLSKIRKQIISDTTATTVKAMLLEMFELMLTDWKPLDPSAKILYESLTKPIVRICD